jgi:hypothetical protein
MKLRNILAGIGLAMLMTTLLGLSRYDHRLPTLAAQQTAETYFGLRYASSGMNDGPRSGIKFCQMQGGSSPPVFCVTEQ